MRVAGQFAGDALSGRLGLFMMTLAYATLGVVLLGYVSTQVYTNSLMERLSGAEANRRRTEEQVGLLMRDYAALVSRQRVSAYCEDRLGMVEGDAGRITRVRLRGADELLRRPPEAPVAPVDMPEVLGSNIVGITEAMRR
jgi:hypothetical protein